MTIRNLIPLAFLLGSSMASALTLQNDTHTTATLSGETVTMTGHSELHLTGSGNPIPSSTIHLNSEDSWVFFHEVEPSDTKSTLLSRIRVNGSVASDGANVRVVQYGQGTVVIPHPSDFQPLEIFTSENFGGQSRLLNPHTLYKNATLGSFSDSIRSFILKRGWMVTFAANESGTESSRLYIAQDSDLEIAVLPSSLDADISFIRIMPWRWTGKKGSCDVSPTSLKADWHYNWNIDKNSSANWEYVGIRQSRWWPGLDQNWQTRGITHLSGYNEPDNPVEDAYTSLNNGSVDTAIAAWPDLLASGLRVGSPAVTDGGRSWLYDFISKADAAGLRVDYVPIHYYRGFSNAGDEAGAAQQLYNFLKEVHDVVQRPIWLTEFNNGANWTTTPDPSTSQNRDTIQAMIQKMDDTSWIERYSVYSRVEWFRQTHYDDGGITPMGAMYRDHEAPIGYQQAVPNSGKSGNASYLFEGNTRDTSGRGNPCLTYGTPSFGIGKHGQAISLDGENDYLRLAGRFGDSSSFTFAAWVKWDGGANWQRIFDFGNGTDSYLFLTPKSGSNTLRFAIKNNGDEQRLDTTTLTPGVWTHIAVTITGDTGKMFINGSRVAINNSMTINPDEIGTETNYIGKSQWPDPLFDGSIDDLRLFNSALSDSAVSALANNNAPQLTTHDPRLATVNLSFTGNLASFVTNGTGPFRFEKIGGPSWLALAADGSFTGVPKLLNLGDNTLILGVTDGNGISNTTTWTITVAAPDPIARYHFENNATCALGNADATLVNNPTYSSGQSGRSLKFDGSNDHAILPEGIASSEELTIATWVRWDGGASWQRIFDFGNGTDSYLFLTPKSNSNTLRFSIKNSGVEQQLNAPALSPGTWRHLAVTLSNGTGKLYLDGILVNTNTTMTIKPSDISPDTNYLGKSQWPDPYFDGQLDDFQIYPRALTQTDIATIMSSAGPAFSSDQQNLAALDAGQILDTSIANQISSGTAPLLFTKLSGPAWLTIDNNGRLSGIPGPEDAGENIFRIQVTDATGLSDSLAITIPINTPSGLFTHYQFNGDSLDHAGTRHGIRNGSPTFTDGLFEEALAFDGSNDYVRLPSGIVSNLNDATFAIRFRWDGGSSWQRLFDFGKNTSQYLFLTPKSGTDTLRFSITLDGNGGQQILEAPRPNEGDWTHVAVTLSGNTGTLYVNGIVADTGTITLNPSSVSPTLNYLGKSQWPDPYFNGIIDDFRIFNRALNANEVKDLAISPAPILITSAYDTWAATFPFTDNQELWEIDADNDGSPNGFEWLHGTDPLNPTSVHQFTPAILPASTLGLTGDNHYLTLTTRIRKNYPGITLIAEGSTDLETFSQNLAILANNVVDDGDFQIFTLYFPISDAPKAFLRIKATQD